MKSLAKNSFVLLVIVLCFVNFGQAQAQSTLPEYEDSLKTLGKLVLYGESDQAKQNANEQFKTLLEEALVQRNSFDYPFDSLITVARLVSPDNKLRIFNWNLPYPDGTYEYFGFIQINSKKNKPYIIYPLIDKSDDIKKPETEILDDENWYGAHYYKLFLEKRGGKRYYMLLGWDGNNIRSTKKIIEVLTFDSWGKPIFGKEIFYFDDDKKKKPARIIFEYTNEATISLKYEKQFVDSGKHKKWMIVFDRIFPLAPNLEGQYEFYVPETNIFDAFIFRKGKWTFIEDVDARNPKEFDKEIPTERTPQKDFYKPIKSD